jgi:hypothetical protein
MTYASFQSSNAVRTNNRTPGEVMNPDSAEIDSNFVNGETTNIPICRVVTRKSGTETTEVALGGSANVLGVTTRSGSTPQGGVNNVAEFEPNRPVNVLRRGTMPVTVAGSGTAGSRAVKYNTTTGVINLGTAGGGEKQLYGVTLENTVSSGNVPALLRFVDVSEDPGYVFDVAVNGTSVVTDGVAAVVAVTGIKKDSGTARVGEISLGDGSGITIDNSSAQIFALSVP